LTCSRSSIDHCSRSNIDNFSRSNIEHCAALQKSCDTRNILCQERNSYKFGHRSRKQSIFDIFWEKFNAPLHPCEADGHLGRHLVTGNSHHYDNHFENMNKPWGIPIGCYNVYM
jgi:hypothetical protein